MKQIFSLLILLSLFMLPSCKEEANPVQNTQEAVKYFEAEMAHKVNPASMRNAVRDNDPNIVIIDLRRKEHFDQGHVPGALNFPFDEWHGFDGSVTNFGDLDKNKMHYVYCYEFYCNLSAKAALLFAKNGYPVKEVRGGFKAYKDHGYPIEPDSTMPAE